MKKLSALICLLLLTAHTYATSIVIVVTRDYIFMGTDSKRQLMNKHAELLAAQTICKIQPVGPYCFAMAGLTTASGTPFNAEAIITRQLKQHADYRVASRHIRRELKQALEHELKTMRVQQPKALEQLLSAGTPVLELVVLSRRHGQPQLEIMGFEATRDGRIRAGSYTTQQAGKQQTSQQIYFMGAYNEMEQQLSRKSRQASPEQLIEELITAQAKATPTAVGAPIHMVQFGSQGMRWIR